MSASREFDVKVEAARLRERTREAQGLPEHVEDEALLSKAAVLIRAGGEEAAS